MSGLGVDRHETEMSGEQNVIIEASVVPLFFADLLFSRDLSSLNHLRILYREINKYSSCKIQMLCMSRVKYSETFISSIKQKKRHIKSVWHSVGYGKKNTVKNQVGTIKQ